jgi:malonyl CoA-acyl carrier protein transacylase
MSLAFLFPCQGSQRPGMLSDLPANQIKDHYLATASEVIGYEIADLESEQSYVLTEMADKHPETCSSCKYRR